MIAVLLASQMQPYPADIINAIFLTNPVLPLYDRNMAYFMPYLDFPLFYK